jgi:ferredoxin/flavodoxin---NADP+ reductase
MTPGPPRRLRDDAMMDFRVAIIGAGPAGYYVAQHLLSSGSPLVHVDMFERLPTPWGLVRAGVAPDHPKIKSVGAQFAEIANHPRYRFFGNVELGREISREDLLARYDAVVYCVGAPSERKLGIPGEDLPGSLAASDFVGWYNGHPDMASLAPDLSGTRAVVIGNGNVALDVARMLLLPNDILSRTDIADHALAKLATSTIRDVTILGRRGPGQATFTTLELREIVGIEGLQVVIDARQLVPLEFAAPTDQRRAQRNLAVLEQALNVASAGCTRRLCLGFLRSPIAIKGGRRVEQLEVRVNRLELWNAQIHCVDTGEREMLPADLVIRAVGYRGSALPGVAFDERSGTIPHVGGAVIPGEREYVAGWSKRGPSGIIGTNRGDAVETAERLFVDLAAASSIAAPSDAILDWLSRTCPDMVDHGGWMRIDRHETHAGEAADRPRVKLVTVDQMLAAARRTRSTTGPSSSTPLVTYAERLA